MSKTYRWHDKQDPRKDTAKAKHDRIQQKLSMTRKYKDVTQSNFGAIFRIGSNDMSNWVYGVAGSDGGFIHTANTEKGAKRKATNDGYSVVYKMHVNSRAVVEVAQKIDNKWQSI